MTILLLLTMDNANFATVPTNGKLLKLVLIPKSIKAALLLHANESAAIVSKDVLRCLMSMLFNDS